VLADDIGMSDIDGRHLRGWLDLLIPLEDQPRWGSR
jgi:hypothetical protein